MKKFVTTLMLLAAFLLPVAMNAQTVDTVTVGTGTSNDYNVPFMNYYNDSWAEMRYAGSRVGQPGSISSVSFECGASSAMTLADLRIYMGMASAEEVTVWSPLSNLQLVYTGTNVPVGAATGWQEFVLDVPYVYSDTNQCLVIVVAKHSSGYSNSLKWNYTSTPSGVYCSMYRRADSDPSYAQHPGASLDYTSANTYRESYTPNVKLIIEEVDLSAVCYNPYDLAVSNIQPNSADLNWSISGNYAGFNVAIGEPGFTTDTVLIDYTTDTFYSFNNLLASHTYEYAVQTVCTDSSTWVRGTFTTPGCDGACFAHIVMHDSYGDGWNGNAITVTRNGDYLLSATIPGGNAGTANVEMCPGDTVEFSWLTGNYASETSFEITDPWDEELYACANGSSMTNGTFFSYTTTCQAPSCMRPSNAHIDSVNATSAFLSWEDDVDNPAGNFVVYWGTSNDPAAAIDSAFVTATSYTITGLASASNYFAWVASDCSDERSRLIPFGAFATSCVPITAEDLPFSIGFEGMNANEAPSCWQVVTPAYYSNYPSPCVVYNEAHSGSAALTLADYNVGMGAGNLIAAPYIEYVNTLQMTFWAKTQQYYTPDVFVVGVVDNDSNFIAVDTFTLTTTYQQFLSYFTGIDDTVDGRIAFYATRDGYYNEFSVLIDDIVISTASDCHLPTGLTATLSDTATLNLHWNGVEDASGYTLVYSNNASDDPDEIYSDGVNVIVATDDSASVSLVSGNLYYFWVRTDCGSSSSDWHGPAVGSTMKTKNMLVTGSDTLYNACGWIIYDNGGPNGNYSDNCLSTLVLYPTEGYLLSISGSGYIENAQWDWLKIFDGTTTNGTPLWAWTSSMSTTFTVPTTNSETGALTLQFKSDGSSNFDGFELFVTCEPMPECPRPGTPVASHPTADGITLSWNENGTATSWFVVYDTVPITDFDSYNPVMVSSNPAIISGLDETTTYYFYVQADCGSNQSQWSNPVVATTGFACDGEYSYASIQQPSTSGNSSVLLNGGWGNSVTQTIYTAAELSQMGLFEGYIHNMSVECTSISTPYAKKQSLYLLATDETTVTTSFIEDTNFVCVWSSNDNTFSVGMNTFRFDSAYYWDGVSNLCVMFINSQDATSANVSGNTSGSPAFRVMSTGVSNSHYRDNSPIDYTNYTTVNSGSLNSYRIAWTIEACINQPSCWAPENLTLSNIDSSSVTLDWDEVGNANTWNVVVTTAPTNHPENEPGMITVTDTNYQVTGLTPNTVYYVYVRSYCDASDQSLWTMPASFRTNCGKLLIPFVENFDSYADNEQATCWTSGGYNNYPYVNTYNGHSGSNSYYMYNTHMSTNPTFYISPLIDTLSYPINTLMTRFWMYASTISAGYPQTMIVGVMTNPNDLSTFYAVDTVTPAATSNWSEIEVRFNTVPDTIPAQYIAFFSKAIQTTTTTYAYNNFYLDDVELLFIPNCDRPNNLVSTNHDTTTIALTWTGTNTDYQVAYGTINDPDLIAASGSGLVSVPGATTTTLTGLTPAQYYYIWVRSDCGNSYSEWRGPITVGTFLDRSLPFNGGFDTLYEACGYHIYDNGGVAGQYTNAYDGGMVLYPSAGSYIVISGTSSSESNYDFLRIYDGVGTSGTQFCNLSGVNQTVGPFSSTSGPVTVVFHSDNSTVNDGFDLYVECFNNSCPVVLDLNATVGTTSANITWTPQGTETAWEVLLDGTSHYVTSPSYYATGLDTLSSYTVEVRPICAAGDTGAFASTTFTTARCEVNCAMTVEMYDSWGDGWNGAALTVSQGTYSESFTLANNDQDIVSITVCAGDSVSLIWEEGAYDSEISFLIMDPNGDTLYVCEECEPADGTILATFMPACAGMAICHVPTIASVTNITFESATINWTSNGSNFEVEVKAAADAIWNDQPTAVAGLTYTFAGLQPATEYQFRVRQDCDTLGYSDWAFGTFTTDSLPCFAPTNLTASNIQTLQADLSWTAGSSETSWMVKYWYGQVFDSVVVSANPTTLTGLMPATAYTAQVKALCGNGTVESDWSDPVSFTTATCAIPTNVAVSNITSNSATVAWTEAGTATEWEISYSYSGFAYDEGTKVTVTTPSYTITGLDANTAYEVMVKANCGGTMSDASARASFTTLNNGGDQGIDNVDGITVTLYPNPTSTSATISLTGVEGTVELTIVDMSGRSVMAESVECASADCVKTLDVRNLAAGAYFVRVSNDSVNMVKRLIVK